MRIPFNRPYMTGKELEHIAKAHEHCHLSGDGPYTRQCSQWLESNTLSKRVLLTHSCTAALEMSALLLDIQPGDEIIMPSYTFVSTANAFVLRGGVPVFVDIREDTLNINENLIEAAITSRTRAIVPVHYAGVACEMNKIMTLAQKYNLKVVEDAAQGMMATYRGRSLGSIGDLGTYSFHETKNVISGEGGALLINESSLVSRAEIIREKGTDRSRFFRGEVDKYTWQEPGSSYLPSELIAAFLWAQLEEAEAITSQRLAIWESYHQQLEELEDKGLLRRPIVPDYCQHNAHMYYILLRKEVEREALLDEFKRNDINSVFHYVPLHTSPAGKRYGRADNTLSVTDDLSKRLVRLPLWVGLSQKEQSRVINVMLKFLSR